MPELPVNLSSGLPETTLPPAPAGQLSELDAAVAAPDDPPGARRDRVASVVAANPLLLEGWATLGDLARDPVEAYAYYRVGYHRGLDRLRGAGWRGSGYVRWSTESNRGFLRALDGLQRMAATIGETDEARRGAEFLRQCDPGWDRERTGETA